MRSTLFEIHVLLVSVLGGTPNHIPVKWAGAKQPVHLFLGNKDLGIRQGMSVWVGSPKSLNYRCPNETSLTYSATTNSELIPRGVHSMSI